MEKGRALPPKSGLAIAMKITDAGAKKAMCETVRGRTAFKCVNHKRFKNAFAGRGGLLVCDTIVEL